MKKHQHGAITLLITSVLLLCALILTLGSYRSIFYQIKRAQNEVVARQQHWQAEGGLECAFTKVYQDKDMTQLTAAASVGYFSTQCSSPLSLHQIISTPVIVGKSYQLSAKVLSTNDSHITKTLRFKSDKGKGAIQTESSIKIIADASVEIAPEVNDEVLNNGKFDCTAMRFKDTVEFIANGNTLQTTLPIDTPADFTECNDYTSLSSNALITQAGSLPIGAFMSDFKHDADIDTFYNYFGMKKTPANLVSVKADYFHIDLTSGGNCATLVKSAFDSGKEKVWVYGDCVISPNLSVMDGAGVITPRSLVVENGVFVTYGANVFDGSFYHLVDMSMFDDPTASGTDLDLLPAYWASLTLPLGFDKSLIEDNSIYIDTGSFFPKGGVFLDTPNGLSTIKGSLNLDFTNSYNPFDEPSTVVWQKGSWHDF
ncbi:hypothetical protein DS893_15545 [Vibrionales bacterium C3R12]|nr:hypothetical protein DS893_15545 [Vibrionales bacterium C3R12]